MDLKSSLQNNSSGFPNFDAMYDELKNAGYPDIKDFKNLNEYEKALNVVSKDFKEFNYIVTKWLPKLEYKVGGVILLKATNKNYDGRVIIPVFNESNSHEKWRICDAIVQNPPLHIEDWLRAFLKTG